VITALGAWLFASLAAGFALGAWRSFTIRMEAVARAAHELRGPLTAARLGLQLGISSGRLAPDRLRAMDLELASAALALDDLAGAGARRRVYRPCTLARVDEVELRQVVADSVEAWRACAASRGAELRLFWSGGAGTVLGDRLRIARATGNLIANAIEHGGGAIVVRGAEQRDGVRIEVIDSGPGLPAPVAELAGRAGRGRSRAERRRKRAGRGRGLAIALTVAAAHGGRLSAAPSERGARLVLWLPACRRAAADSSGGSA
jgi:signal transduction histidine kinase